MTSAISSGAATRLSGTLARSTARTPGSASSTGLAIGVSVGPGQTQLTRTPRGPSSTAAERVKLMTPPLLAA